MDGFLPPVDNASWLDYQRKRAQRFASERIAAAGAGAGDWIGRATRTVDDLVPDWAAPPRVPIGTPPEPEPPPLALQPPEPPSPAAAAGDWAQGALGRIRQIGGDIGEGIGSRIDQAQGILPGGNAWDADLARIRREREAVEQRFPTPEPTGPAGFTLPQTGTPGGERITSALAETATRETPGGSLITAAAREAAPVGPMTAETPLQNVLGMGQLALQNVGAPLPLRGPLSRLGQAIPGGQAVTQTAARAALEAIPGGATPVVPGVQPDTPVLGGLTTPDVALPFAAGALTGSPEETGRLLTGAARRFGRAPEPELGAVAGLGRRSITGHPSGARFGIEGAIEDDIEGQVARRITDPPAVVRTIQGAPGSLDNTALRGTPRTFSPYEPPPDVAARSGARVEPVEMDALINPRLPGARRGAPENQRRVSRAVRSADTLYDYLSGMADDYEGYRDFYPDFGRFYRSIAEPAGDQAEGVFNELSALWAATAAQTAPHDNLTKALMASLGARHYQRVVGRLPNTGEIHQLLFNGKVFDGTVYRGGGNSWETVDPGRFVEDAPEYRLTGAARKLTREDAKKIAQTWETGTIEIPSNFKLTAFNLLNALAARSRYSPFSVIDTHMFRLFGYANPGDAGGSPEASRFVQATIAQLAQEKGWSPHQVQSALWYGAKNEVAPPNAMGTRFADKVELTEETFGLPAGTVVDDGTLAYSVQKNRGLIDRFMAEAAPQGPVNENAARATVVFPGKASARGRPEFRLDLPAQERAETWMENRGYTFTTPVSDAALRALGYDPATGTLGALAERNLPARVVRHPDGTLAVQLYTQSDAAAEEAAGVVGRAPGMAAEPLRPIRPLLDTEGGAATDQVFQVDKADGGAWTAGELAAARQAGVPGDLSPDGLSLVVRADDLGPDVDAPALQGALEQAGAPPLAVQTVPVRGTPGAQPPAGTPVPTGAAPVGAARLASGADGVGTALQRALASVQPYGAARTTGERAFDVTGGTLGGVAGAATAEEDATWQERARRFASGAVAGSLVGPTARGGLGLLARSGDDVLGAKHGARPRTTRRAAPGPAPGTVTLGDIPTILGSVPLMAPSSLGANFTGGMARSLERVLGQAFELRPVDAAVDLANMVKAVPGAVRAFKGSVARGPTAGAQGAMGAPVKGDLSTRGGFWPGALTSGVRVNAATDQFWRDLNEAGAGAVAARRGLSGPAAKQHATRAGDFATFTGTNSIVAKSLQKMKNKLHDPKANLGDKAAAWFVTSTAPYIMMPERLLRATVLAPAEQTYGFAAALKRGDRGAAREAAGRFGASMGVLGVLYAMYQNGQLTGDPPQDANERRRREAQGAEWNTITLPNGAKVPSRYFGSVGMQASLVASVADAAKRAEGKAPGDYGYIWEQRANELAGWALDNSYLSDTADFLTAVGERRFADAARQTAAGTLARPIPILPGIANAADPYERDAGTFPEQVASRTGLRSLVPTRIDPVTGEDQRRRGSGVSRYFGERGAELTPEATELARLGLQPRVLSRTEEFEGAKQTPEQRRKVQRASGSETGRAVRAAIASPSYREADDAGKKKLLEAALREAATRADIVAGEQVARSPQSAAEREWQAVPKYEGVEGTPDEIRRRNAEIARAKAAQAAAKKQGDEALDRWERNNPAQADLAATKPRNARYLGLDREEIEEKHGVRLGG